MFFIGNRFKKKHLLVSESYCRIAIVLFIYVSYTNNTCLYQHPELDLYSASSLKQQSAVRHVAPLGHIILSLGQQVFALSHYCCVLIGEATNTGVRTHDLPHSRQHANHYATNAVQ